jgi:AcrR family transcriptional regulator
MIVDNKKQEIKNHILNFAKDYFFTYGINSVSMSKLAHEMSIGKSTIYMYFPSKEELVIEIIDSLANELNSVIFSIINNTDLSIISRIETLIKSQFKIYKKIMPSFFKDVKQNFIFSKRIDQVLLEFKEKCQSLLEEGKKAGILRRDINPEFTTDLLAYCLDYSISSEAVLTGKMNVEDFVQETLKVFFVGIVNNQTTMVNK